MAITLSIDSILGFFKILSLLQTAVNFQQKPTLGYPPHLKCVAGLPWKTLKSEILHSHARKTCFKCDFLSSTQQMYAKRLEIKCKD